MTAGAPGHSPEYIKLITLSFVCSQVFAFANQVWYVCPVDIAQAGECLTKTSWSVDPSIVSGNSANEVLVNGITQDLQQ